jgi:hypothetical protein
MHVVNFESKQLVGRRMAKQLVGRCMANQAQASIARQPCQVQNS